MELQRRKVDDRIEEKILTGLIVSDSFCKHIVPILKNDSFASPFARQVAGWCIEYYKKYAIAPFNDIQEIFELQKTDVREEDRELIEIFLTRLADDYADGQSINSLYLQDLAVEHIRKRNLKLHRDKIDLCLEDNDIDGAEQETQNYNKVYIDTTGWEDPFTKESVEEYFQVQKDKRNELFKFPGALGNMVGPLERNWLVAFLAPMKRGKSFWLSETAIQSILRRNKTLVISLEMDKQRIRERLYKRILATEQETKEQIYPCWDCLKNQDGSCNKAIRTNNTSLLLSDGKKPVYSKEINYKICTACRGKKDFAVGYWFETLVRKKMQIKESTKVITTFNKMFNRSLRIRSYPAYSANISRIKADIDVLENSQGFIPDTIIIDYADILAPEDKRITGRERLDETWKMLKNLADERHCLVMTASQSNRASINKKFVTQSDIAEDIRKVAHVDAMISINQSRIEKRSSVMRLNMIAERNGSFDEYASCLVLQQLAVGQVCLDSEMLIVENREEEE